MGVGDLKTRLYVKQDLNKGSQIILSKEQAHYLRNVLRLREGDNIALFNGRDGEWKTEIINIEKKNVLVCVNICSRPQEITADIWLIFAPIKGLRVDFIAQKATELGVNMLCPVFTEHTSVTRVNVERLLSNAIEAAEQSGRLSVPQIHSPVRLEKLIEDWPKGRFLFCCDETGGGKPILGAFEENKGPAGLLIGPEGGFSNRELDQLDKLSNVCRVSLGEKILRSDTAAFAALVCWQAAIGDWNAPKDKSND
jgi:16S rRNA (uracil1498-N3)-methyltransferase